jgi:hypothetical protein
LYGFLFIEPRVVVRHGPTKFNGAASSNRCLGQLAFVSSSSPIQAGDTCQVAAPTPILGAPAQVLQATAFQRAAQGHTNAGFFTRRFS